MSKVNVTYFFIDKKENESGYVRRHLVTLARCRRLTSACLFVLNQTGIRRGDYVSEVIASTEDVVSDESLFQLYYVGNLHTYMHTYMHGI